MVMTRLQGRDGMEHLRDRGGGIGQGYFLEYAKLLGESLQNGPDFFGKTVFWPQALLAILAGVPKDFIIPANIAKKAGGQNTVWQRNT